MEVVPQKNGSENHKFPWEIISRLVCHYKFTKTKHSLN